MVLDALSRLSRWVAYSISDCLVGFVRGTQTNRRLNSLSDKVK